MKDSLNLGCGNRPNKGWLNHDKVKHSPHVDVTWDLSLFPWTCPNELVRTSSFKEIEARDVLEHLPPDAFFKFFDSCWDLLIPQGTISIQVPQYGSLNAIVDPTHWRGFHLDSFDILDPNCRLGRANHFYTSKKWKMLEKRIVPNSSTNIFAKLHKV